MQALLEVVRCASLGEEEAAELPPPATAPKVPAALLHDCARSDDSTLCGRPGPNSPSPRSTLEPASRQSPCSGGRKRKAGAPPPGEPAAVRPALPAPLSVDVAQAFTLYCNLWQLKQQCGLWSAAQLPESIVQVFAAHLVRLRWRALAAVR